MNKKGFGVRKLFIEQDFGACSSVGRHEEMHTGDITLAKREGLATMNAEGDRPCTVIKGNSSPVFRNFTDLPGKKNASWRLRSKRSASSPSHRDGVEVLNGSGVDRSIHFLSSTTSVEKRKGTGPLQILRRPIRVDESFALHPSREKSVILSKMPSPGKTQSTGDPRPETMTHAYNYILGAAKKFVDINLPSLSPEKPKICKIAMEKSAAVITCHVPTALFEGLHYDCETIGEASQVDRIQQ